LQGNTTDGIVRALNSGGSLVFGANNTNYLYLYANGDIEQARNINQVLEYRISNANTGASTSSRLYLSTGTLNCYSLIQVVENSGNPYASLSLGSGLANFYLDTTTHNYRSATGITYYIANSTGLTVTGNGAFTDTVSAVTLTGNLNATSLTSGTVPSARISGSYTGITATGTLTSLTVSGGIALTTSGIITANNLLLQGDATNGYVRPNNSGGHLYLGSNNQNHMVLYANGNMVHGLINKNAMSIFEFGNANTGASAATRLYMPTGSAGSWLLLQTNDNAGAATAQLTTGAAITAFYLDSGTINLRNSSGSQTYLTVNSTVVSTAGSLIGAINAANLTSGTLPAARLSGSYTSVTGVGTLTAGTWNATTVAVAYGGTGVTTSTGSNNTVLSHSPTFTGVPVAPTASPSNNSTTVATTAYVDQAIPPGVVVPYAGASVPTGWVFAMGQSLAKTGTYANLFAAIGTTYGSNTTHFTLPDMQGRVAAGRTDMDGSNNNILSTINGHTLGSTGGSQTHTLTTSEIPSHAHSTTDPTHAHSASGAGSVGNNLANGTDRAVGTGDGVNAGFFQSVLVSVAGNITGVGVAANGSGGSHNNLQPTIVLNYIIKY
jgi:microcystin-dependent protein